MKKKNLKKIFIIGIILFLIVLLSHITCQASAVEDLGDLEQYGQIQGSYNVFKSKVGVFLGAFQVLGSILSVICLIVLGIKYMMGSVEQKAEYKKTLFPYMLGAFMVFAISNFLEVVYKIVTNSF